MPKRPRKDHSVELAPPPAAGDDVPDANHADALRALMVFYESGETGDEEENEVDLMSQLSGMTYSGIQSDD